MPFGEPLVDGAVRRLTRLVAPLLRTSACACRRLAVVNLRLVRHATVVVEYAERRLLLDPMLCEAGAMPPFENTPNPVPNPLVSLPVSAQEIVSGVDAVLVTHIHDDHFDDEVAPLLARNVPVLCQPADVGYLKSKRGFVDVRPVDGESSLDGITIARTGGRHGSGELADWLAPVSGFALSAQDEPTLYIAGDTVWCDDVRVAIDSHRPDVILIFAGGARFLEGDPITMTADDIAAVARDAPDAAIVAVHLDAINHCVETRADLRLALAADDIGGRVAIPADGETVSYGLTRPPRDRAADAA
jgi:L-ascorbate metabolism protein UlaG (beta-lactamase superfamily)